jgi:hypothetical protein
LFCLVYLLIQSIGIRQKIRQNNEYNRVVLMGIV